MSNKLGNIKMKMALSKSKTVLVTGANGYIGNAVARAFVRAGWKTYGLVRKEAFLSVLASDEIIALLGSPSDLSFIPSLTSKNVVFDVLVSTTEDNSNYPSHYASILTLLTTLSAQSKTAGIKPLVVFTSGCKDYGQSPLASSPNLAPHTESSPLNPPPVLRPRRQATESIIAGAWEDFDIVALRPTNVYGLGSSYFGSFFEVAEKAKAKGNKKMVIDEDENTVIHGMHIDDCAEAYVALSTTSREVVKGQIYNISAERYETLGAVARALVREYGVEGGVEFVDGIEGREGPETDMRRVTMGFSQWVGSEKLRRDTGWRDVRMGFTEGLGQYRIAFEAAREREMMKIHSF